MNVTFMANIIRKELITRNPEKESQIGEIQTFLNTYSTEAQFTMTTRTGGRVDVTFTVDRTNDYTKFVTVEYVVHDSAGVQQGCKNFSYPFSNPNSRTFNKIVNNIKKDLKLV